MTAGRGITQRAALLSWLLIAVAACTEWGEGESYSPQLTPGEVPGPGGSGASTSVTAIDGGALDGGSLDGVAPDGAPGGPGGDFDVPIVAADVGGGGSGSPDGVLASDVQAAGDGGAAQPDADPNDAGGTVDGGAVDGGVADGGAVDGGVADGGTLDGGVDDGGTVDGGTVDGGAVDGGAVDGGTVDGGTVDGGAVDGGTVDGGTVDGGTVDGGVADGGVVDGGTVDGGVADGGTVDGGVVDGVVTDGGVVDVDVVDSGADTGVSDAGAVDTLNDTLADTVVDSGPLDAGSDVTDSGPIDTASDGAGPTLPDAPWTPDWGGYPDATWPSDVDVYGGTISSCFNAYSYVFVETCTGKDLSTACVNSAAQDASLHTQFLFQPLRECANTNCVPVCAKKGGDTFACIEACMGKHCAFPLFACITQGETGTKGCPDTFKCLKQYDEKIISIANKCFAPATAKAQKQLADFFACGVQPQSDSCFDQLNACYGSGNASCLGMIQCSEACPEGDEICGFQCFGQGSPKAQQQLDALWDCIFANCSDCGGPNGCSDACHSKFCQKQQTTCIFGL